MGFVLFFSDLGFRACALPLRVLRVLLQTEERCWPFLSSVPFVCSKNCTIKYIYDYSFFCVLLRLNSRK